MDKPLRWLEIEVKEARNCRGTRSCCWVLRVQGKGRIVDVGFQNTEEKAHEVARRFAEKHEKIIAACMALDRKRRKRA